MNQTKKLYSAIGVTKLVEMLRLDPERALEHIIDSHIYLSKRQDSVDFWLGYETLDKQSVIKTFPEAAYVFHTLGKLHLFFDLYNLYHKEIVDYTKRIRALKPSPELLLKTLFLALELGSIYDRTIELPQYSIKSLKAIKEILSTPGVTTSKNNAKPYSIDLFNCAKQLLMLKVDLATLFDFVNAFEWGRFDLEQIEGNNGYRMFLPEYQSKVDNPFILSILKNDIKRNVKRKESQSGISQEKHFQKHDAVFKTNEGLPAIFYSGCDVVSQPDGIAAVKLEGAFWDKIGSSDPRVQEQGQIEWLEKLLEGNFLYQFRQALSGIYCPNDIISLHDYTITLSKVSTVTLYELFCVTSCLSALSDNLRYVSELPGSGSLHQTVETIALTSRSQNPSVTDEGVKEIVLATIANNWDTVDRETSPFYILNRDVIFKHLRKIEELTSIKDTGLEAILDTISSLDNQISFNPLYKIGAGYFLSVKACSLFDLNRTIYDHFVADRLFNSQKKTDALVDKNHKTREEAFNEAIENALSTIANKVKSNLDYSRAQNYDFNGLKGEFDVLAYFENENIIVDIIVKLSNTSIWSEKRKNQWVNTRLYDEAKRQALKDGKFLSSVEGLRFVSDQFGLKAGLRKPRVFHLIVTDNFYADHEEIPLDDGDSVLCISYFELYNLVYGIRIDPMQAAWKSVIEDKSAENLIFLILQNVFWSFLAEKAGGFHLSESLRLINKEGNIKLVV